ncbi:MAG: cation-translocating P-type ATPase [Bacteroidetes bacterium]|nr:MAG: cation-translocating P-type ATPase [Bacteroidota bacterium]
MAVLPNGFNQVGILKKNRSGKSIPNLPFNNTPNPLTLGSHQKNTALPSNHNSDIPLYGLTDAEVRTSRAKHGRNVLFLRPKRQFWHILVEVIREPVFILLVLACLLYFILGDDAEAWLMVAALCFVTAIEIVQEYRSEKTLLALRKFTQPNVRVIRNGTEQRIPAEEVVQGDIIQFSEGERLVADAQLVQQYDLSVDEALLTGESLPVYKSTEEGNDLVYQGTVVTSGMGIGQVGAIGHQTKLGKLGTSIESIDTSPTPLQQQIDRFVRQMMLAGLVAFLLVFAVNIYYVGSVVSALLFSLALALALVPAEIPVAFASFLALGAYRMSREKILVRQPRTVESLGSATVICLDKTGTITENRMEVAEVLEFTSAGCCLEYAMWASEPHPFDAMELAIHQAYTTACGKDRRPEFRMIHEYPLGGLPPMMTHIYENDQGIRVVAAKGAVERLLNVCHGLDDASRTEILKKTHALASSGHRILGVARADWSGMDYPEDQDAFPWEFVGMVALYDPPKANIRSVLEQFYQAGIQIKMITGDYPETALNIARQSGLKNNGKVLTGPAVLDMSKGTLEAEVGPTAIFARMFPEAKLRVIEALKAAGAVVAMTGDGVNDGPALKAAQVGVAMGQRGTEVAQSAASMVLVDDDLTRMVTAIRLGRNIYNNLRKAIRYVISIHTPIILVVILPLLFGWPYLYMLGPIHVIFMELIMDPTCAIMFENEPAEPGLMRKSPRKADTPLFTRRELLFSIFQGLMITAGVLGIYHFAIAQGANEAQTRAYVFTTLMLSNIFLTLANRSFEYSIFQTIRQPNRYIPIILTSTLAILAAILFIPWVNHLFRMAPMHIHDIGLCVAVSLASVGWFEVWKIFTSKTSGSTPESGAL